MSEFEIYDENDVQENKVIAALSYLGLLVLVPLLAKKDSPFCQFHAKQGLVLLVAWVIIGAVSIIPILGWIIGILCSIFLFACFIIGILNALTGEIKELPLIGQYSSLFNL
jgi:uncharacterized membrane protein